MCMCCVDDADDDDVDRPALARGYFKDAERTREDFDEQTGWFSTGE
jgi:acyl-CoA synthetase (AMP-forming)/AMP-acid ligase II